MPISIDRPPLKKAAHLSPSAGRTKNVNSVEESASGARPITSTDATGLYAALRRRRPKARRDDEGQTPLDRGTTADLHQPHARQPSTAKAGRVCEAARGTFRISRDPAAAYRVWSWEGRCQLSELVEQALLTYRESRDQHQ